MVFVDLPVAERVRRLTALDVQVEIWDWTRHDLHALEKLRDEGAVYSSMTGYVTGGSSTPTPPRTFWPAQRARSQVAQTTRHPSAQPARHRARPPGAYPSCRSRRSPAPMWVAAVRTLERVARLGEQHDVTFVLENLNTAVDHPGVPFARAEDCLGLVQAVDNPHLRLMLDLYHAQIGEGNLIELCRRALPGSARSRWPTSPAAANPAPARSPTRRSPRP